MKLTELEPRWFTYNNLLGKHGITFLCPHCKTTRIGVPFHHEANRAMFAYLCSDAAYETDTPELHIGAKEGALWSATGETFDDLSLSPSVDASASGHWHGFITNGEVR